MIAEPTDKELAASLKRFADLLHTELGWMGDGELHLRNLYLAAQRLLNQPRPADEWHEDIGDVLWWKFPIDEPPYIGTPNDLGQTVEVTLAWGGGDAKMAADVGGWPGYHTHWTRIPPPFGDVLDAGKEAP